MYTQRGDDDDDEKKRRRRNNNNKIYISSSSHKQQHTFIIHQSKKNIIYNNIINKNANRISLFCFLECMQSERSQNGTIINCETPDLNLSQTAIVHI